MHYLKKRFREINTITANKPKSIQYKKKHTSKTDLPSEVSLSMSFFTLFKTALRC